MTLKPGLNTKANFILYCDAYRIQNITTVLLKQRAKQTDLDDFAVSLKIPCHRQQAKYELY